ncbi:hypothetical protein [Oenococcus sicerae]|uniref:hypothetical protein n=1 Tax=Oenococcus sicerae TaxID=2203724 RepID=UPI002659CB0B|nr:hypothetical protein [Oenococcus sicerae]
MLDYDYQQLALGRCGVFVSATVPVPRTRAKHYTGSLAALCDGINVAMAVGDQA